MGSKTAMSARSVVLRFSLLQLHGLEYPVAINRSNHHHTLFFSFFFFFAFFSFIFSSAWPSTFFSHYPKNSNSDSSVQLLKMPFQQLRTTFYYSILFHFPQVIKFSIDIFITKKAKFLCQSVLEIST